jgi:hypothetical protein
MFFHSEPGHPQELALVLLLAFAACPLWVDFARRRAVLMLAMGSLAGALLLIKVNIGAYVLASLVLALLAHSPPIPLFRYLKYAAGVGCMTLPVVLMFSHLTAFWAQTYCFLVTASIFAAIFCLWRVPRPCLATWRDPIMAACGCAFMVAAATVVLAAQRVSLPAALDSMVFLPARIFRRNWYYPPHLSGLWMVWALLGIGAAIWMLREQPVPGSPQWRRLLLLKTTFTAAALAAIGLKSDMFPLVAPFAWLVLFNPVQTDRDAQEFPRTLLYFVTVMQTLYAYPVYGSQSGFIQCLPLVVVAVCAGDSLGWLTGLGARPAWFVDRGRAIATVALVAIAMVNLKFAFDRYNDYRELPSLDLPGAGGIHIQAGQRKELASLVENVARSCDVFESLPGLPSLHFWTGIDPETGLNWGAWILFFSAEQQSRVIHALSGHPRACVVYHPVLAALYDPDGHRDIESLPLVGYIQREFKPVMAGGEYRLLIRKERAWPTSDSPTTTKVTAGTQ